MDERAAAESAQLAERLNDALRSYGTSYGQLAREFAASEGLHSTDATALIEILAAEERGTPLSPARLSQRIGLSFGATSTLLNRLEDFGHIRRSREHSDRRLVTLRSTPNVQDIAESFFHPLGERISQVIAHHPPELVEQFETLLNELSHTMEQYISDVVESAEDASELSTDAPRPKTSKA